MQRCMRVSMSFLLVAVLLAVTAVSSFAAYEPPTGYPSFDLRSGVLITNTDVTTGLTTLLAETNVQGLLIILVVLMAFGSVAGWFGARRGKKR